MFTNSQPSLSSDILYQLPPSTTIYSNLFTYLLTYLLFVQFMCLTVLFHNLPPGPLWSSSWPGTLSSYSIYLFANNTLGTPRTTSPASGSHCARSFVNRKQSHERTFINPGTPTISSNLRPQQNVNRTTMSDADFKAYSMPKRKLTETTTAPVLRMKWKRTFSTTTRGQHSVPLRHL